MNFLHGSDERKNFLSKGDYKTAEETEEALRTLACIVALDGHTNLNDTPAEDNNTNGLDTGKDEVRKVIHDGQRITRAGGIGRGDKEGEGESEYSPCTHETLIVLLH